MSSPNLAIICSDNPEPVKILLETLGTYLPEIPIKLLISGRAGTEALSLGRNYGVYSIFVPRGAYHANVEGYERRLVELIKENAADTVILVDYQWQQGESLKQSFPGHVLLFETEEPQKIINSINLLTSV